MTISEFRNYTERKRFRSFSFLSNRQQSSSINMSATFHCLFSSIALCDHPNIAHLSNPFCVLSITDVREIECDEQSLSPSTLIKIHTGIESTCYIFEAS